MSIIDEALKKLGSESSPEEASPFSRKMDAAGSMSDVRFVVGPRKRRPISFLLAVALVGAGVIIYLLLPGGHEIRQPAREAPAGIDAIASSPVAANKDAVATVSTPSPPVWYEDGWRAARTGKWTDAFAHWEGGMRGLPRDRMVIVSSSYTNLDLFASALNQHASMFPAIGVRQHAGGQTQYRVIVFPYGGDTRQLLPKVQNLFSRAGLVNASRVQEHLTESSLPSVANPAQETLRAETPVVSQKQMSDTKLAVEQKLPSGQEPPEGKLDSINRVAADTVMATNAGDWETRSATLRDLLKAEDYPEVSKIAQTLTRDFSERWEGWFWLGTAQLAQGQMDAAEAVLERASKLNPKVAQIWVQRAIVAQERGDHAAAVKLLNEARELSPKSPQIYLNLGYSNDALGLTAEAEKNYIRFLSLTEGDSTYALQRKPIMGRLESKH